MKQIKVYGAGCKRCDGTIAMAGVISTPGVAGNGKLVHARAAGCVAAGALVGRPRKTTVFRHRLGRGAGQPPRGAARGLYPAA